MNGWEEGGGVRVELWKRKLLYSMVAKTTDHENGGIVCVLAGCEPLQGEELPDHESAGESAQCASLQGRREREREREREGERDGVAPFQAPPQFLFLVQDMTGGAEARLPTV